ncbi:MAG: TIGR00730 family Rossman fold protein [Desulfobacterales bacterium]|jgi:hypothetical protein|nr:TIGR00730 family Rossman fold protein [Desulfobacterales bacterium]
MNLRFAADNGAVDAAITQLLDLAGPIHQRGLVREMIIATLKAGRENPEKADLKIMSSTLKEMRYTAKVFSGYRCVRKVSVFGSARTPAGHPLYRLAQEFGHALAAKGFMVITGGGAGIMQAANEGAGAEKSFGVGIRLPFETKSNPVLDGSPRDITFKYFFNRKLAFIKEACAVALFPGGFGTLDEAMEALTLLQTGKRYPIPVILVDGPGGRYWQGVLGFMKDHLAPAAYIGPNDFAFFQPVAGVEEGVAVIERFYHRYHSLRFVGGQTVIRMASGLPASRVDQIRREFADILTAGGDLAVSDPLSGERDEPEIKHLPRLVLDFNKQDFARLRQLIDAVNASD